MPVRFNVGGGGGVTSDDVTAARADVVAGKRTITTDSGDEVVEGTLADMPRSTQATKLEHNGINFHMYLPNGAYRQTGLIWDSLANLRKTIGYTDASKVLTGTTIAGLAGTMPNRGWGVKASAQGINDKGFYFYIPEGFYQTDGYGGSWVYRTLAETRSADPNIIAGNIKKGTTIFGVTGTFEGWVATVNDVYKYGVTGSGYSFSPWHAGGYSGTIQIRHKNSSMGLYAKRDTPAMVINKLIDFTKYKKVEVEFYGINNTSSTKRFYIYVNTAATGNAGANDIASTYTEYTTAQMGVPLKCTLDVTSINGSYYLAMGDTNYKTEEESCAINYIKLIP